MKIDTIIAADLRARRAKFGTLTITTRWTGHTYKARAAGVRGRSTSCTAGPEPAVAKLAAKIFDVPEYHLDLRCIATTVYYVDVADPDSLTEAESKALGQLIEAGGMVDVVSPILARTLRRLQIRRDDLVRFCDAPPDSAGAKPYFGAVVTAAGRAAYAASKGVA